MEGLTEGRIVHFVMPNGKHRPAIIVETWNNLGQNVAGTVNLQVFCDGTNDSGQNAPYEFQRQRSSGGWDRNIPVTLWEPSVPYDAKGERIPRTWHWIERA